MISEAQARTVHSIHQVQMVSVDVGPDVDWLETPDGIAIKELYFAEPGIFVGQHAHEFPHYHLVGSGEVRVWVEDEELGDFKAGQLVHIEAGKRHTLMSLRRDTRGFCLTNEKGLGRVLAISKAPV